jgi:hypothetical protein
MSNPTVKDIVGAYLISKGYTGLYCPDDDECACDLEELMCCSEYPFENNPALCQAGYKAACDCGDHKYHILEKKP